jgi:hypothetical protein
VIYDQLKLIHSGDWDILIILDACRYDYFEKLNTISGKLLKAKSVNSSTPKWAEQTWTDYYQIAYVSGNPYISKKKNVHGWSAGEHFLHVEEVWDWGWRDYKGVPTVPAEEIVKGVKKVLSTGYKKIIAHFMQPHPPYIGKTLLPIETFVHARFEAKGIKKEVKHLHYRDVDTEILRQGYADNLIYVLENGVEPLLDQLSAEFKIVVSADHGELLGEYNNFGHPDNWDVPELREVPWLEVR